MYRFYVFFFYLLVRRPPRSTLPATLLPCTSLFRSFEHRGPSDQQRPGELLVDRDRHGAQHALLFAFGKHDAALVRCELARGGEDRLHQRAAVIDELLQALTVGVEVVDRP